jgi:hypothetical protein
MGNVTSFTVHTFIMLLVFYIKHQSLLFTYCFSAKDQLDCAVNSVWVAHLARVKMHEACKPKKTEGKLPFGRPSNKWENNV